LDFWNFEILNLPNFVFFNVWEFWNSEFLTFWTFYTFVFFAELCSDVSQSVSQSGGGHRINPGFAGKQHAPKSISKMARGSFGASSGIVGNDAGRFEAEASKDGGSQTGRPRQHGESSERYGDSLLVRPWFHNIAAAGAVDRELGGNI
jgi:hypothetical protein